MTAKSCEHSPDELCLFCRPTPVPDGRAMLDAFKKEHGIKDDQHARSLMFIETFRPLPRSEAF
jgi:hypothetical protein